MIYFIVIIVCVMLEIEPRDSHIECKGSTAQ